MIAGFDERRIPLIAVISNFDTETGIAKDPETFELTQRLPLDGHPTGSVTIGAPVKAPIQEFALAVRSANRETNRWPEPRAKNNGRSSAASCRR